MKITIHKAATVAAVALALPLLAMAPTAQAVVMNWYYDVDTGFSDFDQINPGGDGPEDGTGVVPDNPNTELPGSPPTELTWGAEGGSLAVNDAPPSPPGDSRSGITVTPEVTPPPVLETGGSFVPGATFTHINNTILDGAIYLDTATILNRVVLTPDPSPGAPPPTGSPADSRSFTFRVDFAETQNDGACPGDNGTNSATAGPEACDDIFVLTAAPTGDQRTIPGGFAYDFLFDDILYTVVLQIEGLDFLGEDVCDAAGAATDCVGVLTNEEEISEIMTEFRIVAAVPEPGTLSIMALGLICLALAGFSRNRRAG